MNQIGIMQGRLSPPINGRMQAFPWSSWQAEFETARDLGYDLIEWLFDPADYERNPLWTPEGVREINSLVERSGVGVRSCCAHYFMVHPFFRVSETERLHSIAVLERLIDQAALAGIQTILLPVLETSEVRSQAERDLLLTSLSGLLDHAASSCIKLGLEMELPADEYASLVRQANHPALGVYYDTGNNTARGYDVVADLPIVAPLLAGVHIKDRKSGGPNVLLGQGGVDFDDFFPALHASGYTGPVVLETTTGDDHLANARRHLDFVRQHLLESSVKRLEPFRKDAKDATTQRLK